MYEDNYKSSIDWKPFYVKGSIFLGCFFILFIVALVYTNLNKEDETENYVTAEVTNSTNLTNMKVAAIEYYTEDLLPETLGKSKSLTLEQMIKLGIIDDFSEEKNCSITDSYVKVTKTNSNTYVFKVLLTCNGNEEFIIKAIEK